MMGSGRYGLPVWEWISHRDKGYSIGIQSIMLSEPRTVADGCCPCGEHSGRYRDVDSLCCAPEANIILCVNCTRKIF